MRWHSNKPIAAKPLFLFFAWILISANQLFTFEIYLEEQNQLSKPKFVLRMSHKSQFHHFKGNSLSSQFESQNPWITYGTKPEKLPLQT